MCRWVAPAVYFMVSFYSHRNPRINYFQSMFSWMRGKRWGAWVYLQEYSFIYFYGRNKLRLASLHWCRIQWKGFLRTEERQKDHRRDSSSEVDHHVVVICVTQGHFQPICKLLIRLLETRTDFARLWNADADVFASSNRILLFANFLVHLCISQNWICRLRNNNEQKLPEWSPATVQHHRHCCRQF